MNQADIEAIKASLKERIKELECLYSISEIAFKFQNAPLAEVFHETLKSIPKGWQFPELTCAQVFFDQIPYRSQAFKDSAFKQVSPLIIHGKIRGHLEVIYKKKTPVFDEGPFLKEERALIDNIARKLSMVIEQHEERKERKILESNLIHADRLVTIGELTAGIAHELNEPLGSILGFAQLIKGETNLPENIAPDMDKIIQASLHAREVIRKLMTFSRYEEKPSEPTNLNTIINDGLYLLESRCKKENIEIIKILETKLPLILASRVQLHQVVVNLCVNAIQAMPNGGQLILQTHSKDEKSTLIVQDTGIGISSDHLDKIFDPFFSLKDSEINTGLGLSVVHGIVSQYKGEIKLESTLGIGTRFEISFPALIPEVKPNNHD